MGCSFFACFGSSKHKKPTPKVQLQENGSSKPQQQQQSVVLPLVQDHSETLLSPSVQQLQDKTEEERSVGVKKKVTFDSNVKTYESVLSEKDTEGVLTEKDTEGVKEESSAKTTQSKSFSSEDSSVTSTGSYPSNHRYQNCRDSDGEDEEIDDWVDDLSDDDEDDGIREECDGLGVEFEEDELAYSKPRVIDNVDHVFAEEVESEVESPIPICEKDVETIGFNPNARDRSDYVHPVLNPVENISQWKAVKARRRPTLRPQKENNVFSNPESKVSFGAKEVSESDTPKKSNKEIAVDASLSNWLGSSETTPVNKTNLYPDGSFGTPDRSNSHQGSKTTMYAGGSFGTPDRNSSHQGSNSVMSLEDRPILGALTVEEIKQFSATPSPRKSPSKSPDDMPIIGTVGSYWHFAEDSGSASSFKGIPNTTSKYREDRKVNWHTTPFETRLEKAMNRGDVSESC
ncbi:uncharacterized protein LOC131632400 [Vicia villosa]|uniref:uncharacterized protein LOC131632400 n=1 Tax=Vicia villosa TaxID=3911 RepID=UPI00273CC40F|nr:uncharacterized protein LOC131632400 [Vicia villosa]